MKSRTFLILGCLVACTVFTAMGRADDRRFSATLNATEPAQVVLSRLSSDQVAVMDALVRKDLVIAEADPTPTTPRASQFSQRISAEERRAAGFALLSETEVVQIDASVEKFVHPATISGSFTDQSGKTTSLTSVMLRRDPEIHGSITLMVAGGSHGYRAYGGAIELNYVDPAHHFEIDVGYSEIHSSGGYGYFGRSCRNRY